MTKERELLRELIRLATEEWDEQPSGEALLCGQVAVLDFLHMPEVAALLATEQSATPANARVVAEKMIEIAKRPTIANGIYRAADEKRLDAMRAYAATLLTTEQPADARSAEDTARIASLQRTVAAKQAHIDRLMLEYCPEDMTPLQIEEWKKHQIAVTPEAEAAITAATEQPAVKVPEEVITIDENGIVHPPSIASTPLLPSPAMIEAGAQRLVRWETGQEKWPDAWSKLDVRAARNDAERCWRSMWLVAALPAAAPSPDKEGG